MNFLERNIETIVIGGSFFALVIFAAVVLASVLMQASCGVK